jgi:serine/threonine protein kinase
MTEMSPAEALFFAALERPPGQRAAFLDQACAGNAELRARLDQMLAAHPQLSGYLDPAQPAAQVAGQPTAAQEPAAEAPGTIIAGKYKLLQKLGEGGMGAVWMADQLAPVKRRVAVKLIRSERGDSRSILARFEAERQAVALMDHPHIARLLDAGTTGAGQPYFVMELVKGIPLNDFCDQHKLSVADRLQLFLQICSAVQHAHQKGIIHRDLKPSNILVESHDGKPVPKVIDFGLAKATSGLHLTEHTLFTALGTVAGTPLYMAPEQAAFNALDIDTRADIYALGVVLYELLTGTTPIAREQLKQAAFDEILRLIRESEPPTPSKRLTSADTKPSVAASRQTEALKLSHFVRGDLDWIVMKALAKERDRRYETANGLARDIERFLNHEPVLAGPPSAAYRLRKFVRRNRPQVLAGCLLLLALLGGIVGTTLGLLHAEQRRAEAEHARADEAAQRGIAQANEAKALSAAAAEKRAKEREAEQRGIAQANATKALAAAAAAKTANEREARQRRQAEQARDRTRQALDAMTSSVTGDSLSTQKALSAEQKKFLTEVLTYYQEFAGEKADDERSRARTADAAFRVGMIESRLGRKAEAAGAYRLARDEYAKLAADFPAVRGYRRKLANSHNNLGVLLIDMGKQPEAEAQYRQALAIREKLAADFPVWPRYRQELARSYGNLGVLLAGLAQRPEAAQQFRKALAIQEQLASEYPAVPVYRRDLAVSHNNLGLVLAGVGKRPEAEKHYLQALAIQESLAADFPALPMYRQELAISHNSLGVLLKRMGKQPEAEAQYRQALAIQDKLAADFPAVPKYRDELAASHFNLGLLLKDLGKRSEAEAQYRQALAIREKLAADFPAVLQYQVELGGNYCNYGNLIRDGGKPRTSLEWFGKAIRTLMAVYEQDRRLVMAKRLLRNSHEGRAKAYDQLQKHAEAIKDRDKVVELSPPQERPEFRAARAVSRLRAGQVAEAVAEVAELMKSSNWNARQWYDFACVYAVASGKSADKKQECADRAMDLLHKAVKAGYSDAAHMRKDAELDPIRARDDFKQLIAELEKKAPGRPEKHP